MSIAYKSGPPLPRGPSQPTANSAQPGTNGFDKESLPSMVEKSPMVESGWRASESAQETTFLNWTNYILRTAPREPETVGLQVKSALTDFRDGIVIARLVGELQRRAAKSASPPEWTKSINIRARIASEHLNNMSLALQALRDDGVKLVNIGVYLNDRLLMNVFFLHVFCIVIRTRRYLRWQREAALGAFMVMYSEVSARSRSRGRCLKRGKQALSTCLDSSCS